MKAQPPEKLANDRLCPELSGTGGDQGRTRGKWISWRETPPRCFGRHCEIRPFQRNSSPSGANTPKRCATSLIQRCPRSLPQPGFSSQTAKGRPDDLARALKQEEQIVQSLRELQAPPGRHLDSLAAANIALRLRKVAASETSISKKLRDVLPETVGLKPSELAPNQRESIDGLQTRQDASRMEAGKTPGRNLPVFRTDTA